MTAEVTLADKVDVLGAARTYLTDRPELVLARETHMSWVFDPELATGEVEKNVVLLDT
jgi:hypothetical protein